MTQPTDLEIALWGLYDTAFNREPDPEGLRFWAGEVSSGRLTLHEVATLFVASEEFEIYHEGRSTDELILKFYDTSFGRIPSAEEADWWGAYADQGHGAAHLLAGFAFSDEQRSGIASGVEDATYEVTGSIGFHAAQSAHWIL